MRFVGRLCLTSVEPRFVAVTLSAWVSCYDPCAHLLCSSPPMAHLTSFSGVSASSEPISGSASCGFAMRVAFPGIWNFKSIRGAVKMRLQGLKLRGIPGHPLDVCPNRTQKLYHLSGRHRFRTTSMMNLPQLLPAMEGPKMEQVYNQPLQLPL